VLLKQTRTERDAYVVIAHTTTVPCLARSLPAFETFSGSGRRTALPRTRSLGTALGCLATREEPSYSVRGRDGPTLVALLEREPTRRIGPQTNLEGQTDAAPANLSRASDQVKRLRARRDSNPKPSDP
jgi:hypothetical protein